MSLFIASLNSGSNGNCYYIGNSEEAVFVDAGLSCRETEIRMKRLGLKMGQVKAIFISHEHSDHIIGVNQLVSKYQIPVYVSQATLKEAGFWKIRKFTYHFTAQQAIQIGGLQVTAFQKNTMPATRTVSLSAQPKPISAFSRISVSPVSD